MVNVTPGTARFGLGPFPPPPQPGNEIEYIAWFRFPVTWNYLCGAAPPVEPALRMRPVAKPSPSAVMELVSNIVKPPSQATPALDTVKRSGASGPTDAKAQWEMVIPKMVRPVAKPVVDRIAAAPFAPAPAAVPSAGKDNGAKPCTSRLRC